MYVRVPGAPPRVRAIYPILKTLLLSLVAHTAVAAVNTYAPTYIRTICSCIVVILTVHIIHVCLRLHNNEPTLRSYKISFLICLYICTYIRTYSRIHIHVHRVTSLSGAKVVSAMYEEMMELLDKLVNLHMLWTVCVCGLLACVPSGCSASLLLLSLPLESDMCISLKMQVYTFTIHNITTSWYFSAYT